MPTYKFPTGVTIHNPKKAHDCHVLYEGRDGVTYLVDMAGHDIHTWPHSGFPSEMIDEEPEEKGYEVVIQNRKDN